MESLESRFASVSVKAAVIAGLTLLMLWPLSRVESLVSERQTLQAQAYDVIAAGFGGSQVLGAPILTVDTQDRKVQVNRATQERTETWAEGAPLHLLPDEVQITNEVSVEVRSKGIYSVPVYVSKVVMTGVFKPEAIASLLLSNADLQVLPTRAVFQLPLSGVKYLRALTRFEVDGQSSRAGSGEVAGFTALSTPIDLKSRGESKPLAFRLEFEIAGSESLHFLPLGSHTAVTASVAWPHPDFDGAFLPQSRDIKPDGYSAKWEVLELNRAYPQAWRGATVTQPVLLATAFGVRLFQPSNIYTQNYRAVRYGILFVAITFACFFAWEHLVRGLRLHPMQYLLVGLALATFYLLLLALSEHIGFALSYGLAAAALVALITTYIAGATNNRLAAFGIGGALASTYGILYVILLSEDYALLFGSLLLFVILGAWMVATRRLDWSRVGRENAGQ
ncbi:MAG TPA: cell envelope integrity protein CreD [Steroidobacteraceae bacterium]|nr:cell envelope integrity protein CreD [Steroidobacteraceae bacterium]